MNSAAKVDKFRRDALIPFLNLKISLAYSRIPVNLILTEIVVGAFHHE